ncbi:MAG: VTT domain-containing protein [Pseudomonadota bacterium]
MSSHRESIVAIAFGVMLGLTIVTIFFDAPFSMAVRDNAAWIGERVTTLFSAESFSGLGQKVRDLGLTGAIIAMLLYAIGSMVAFPASIMTLICVLAFGFGAVLVTGVGAFLGLAASFFVSRTFFQHHINWFCSRYPVTRGVERAVQSNGFWLVFLMRQSPVIPFAAQNYMFGMLQTRARDYLIASGLGIIPGTIAKVYVFESARSAVRDGLSPVQLALVAVGTTATIAVMILVGRYVRRELASQTA